MAVCRGAEGADWLATRGADDTDGPAAPARALYLEGFALYLAKSDARCADVDEATPAEARRRARERAREREARRDEDYDAEAARRPEPTE